MRRGPAERPTRYYAGGARIAWSGQEFGGTKTAVWSIDANGGDVKQLSFGDEADSLSAIWDPTPAP